MRSTLLGIGFALFALAGCSSGDEEKPNNPGGTGGTSSVNDCEGRGEPFSAGMAKLSDGGAVKVVLVKSDIAPPGQGINTWTIRLSDASDQPLTGAKVSASFMMPDHTHPPQSKDGRESAPGTYEVLPYFSMPGLWETTVTVTPSGGAETSVLFSFCIGQD
jgi:YtkA-like